MLYQSILIDPTFLASGALRLTHAKRIQLFIPEYFFSSPKDVLILFNVVWNILLFSHVFQKIL